MWSRWKSGRRAATSLSRSKGALQIPVGWIAVAYPPVTVLRPTSRSRELIRDADVGAFVDGATLTFTAQSIQPGSVYTSYPNSSNAPRWATTADGGFPSNVLLPPAQWQLTAEKSGYSNYLFDGINLPMPPPQFTSNLGTLFLSPLDTNMDGFGGLLGKTVFWRGNGRGLK